MLKSFIPLICLLLTITSCDRYSKYRIVESSSVTQNAQMLNYLNDLLEEDDTNPQIYYKRAQVYFDQKDIRKSLIDIQKAIELKSTDPDFYMLLSIILDQRGESEACLLAALQAEQRGLHNYDLYRILAVNYLKIDDAENAKKSIERLLDFNKNGENLSLQGDIFLQLGDTTAATKSYTEAIDLNEKIARPYKEMYKINKIRGNYKRAENYVDQYLEIDSENPDFLVLKSTALVNRKSYDSALLCYKKAKVLNSNDKRLLLDYGKLYYTVSLFDSALLIANKVIQIDSQYVAAQLLSARSLDKLKDYKSAKSVYEAILASDSTMQIAADELEILNRKVAYLWRLQEQEKTFDSIRNSPPPSVERKEIEN